MQPKWLITDSFLEAVSALEELADNLRHVSTDLYRWKWAIISLHSATQCLMVLALQGSHGLRVLKECDAQKWLEAYRKGAPPPENLQMQRFLDLYKKIKSDAMLMYEHSKQFAPREDQEVSIIRLNEIRNLFVHFIPQVLILDVFKLPALCLKCVDVAEFLAWQSGNVVWTEEKLKERAKSACDAARQTLVSLKQQYDS